MTTESEKDAPPIKKDAPEVEKNDARMETESKKDVPACVEIDDAALGILISTQASKMEESDDSSSDEDECTPAESRKREVAGRAAGVGKLTAEMVNNLIQGPLRKACCAIKIPVKIPKTSKFRPVNDLKKDLLKAIGCEGRLKKTATRRARVSVELVDEARAELLKDECLEDIVHEEGFSHKNDNDAQRVLAALKEKYGSPKAKKMPAFKLAGGEWYVYFLRGTGIKMERAKTKVDQMSRAEHEGKKSCDRKHDKTRRDKVERETGKRNRGAAPASFPSLSTLLSRTPKSSKPTSPRRWWRQW